MKSRIAFNPFILLAFFWAPQMLKSETADKSSVFSSQIVSSPHFENTTKPLTLKHAKKHWLVKRIVGRIPRGKINSDNYGLLSVLFGAISLALLGLMFYLLAGVILVFAVISAIVAIVFSIKGLRKGRKNKWAAILGLIVTIPTLIMLGLLIALISLGDLSG